MIKNIAYLALALTACTQSSSSSPASLTLQWNAASVLDEVLAKPLTAEAIEELGQRSFAALYEDALSRATDEVIHLGSYQISGARSHLVGLAPLYKQLDQRYPKLSAFWSATGLSVVPETPTLASVEASMASVASSLGEDAGLALANYQPVNAGDDKVPFDCGGSKATQSSLADVKEAYNSCVAGYARAKEADESGVDAACTSLTASKLCPPPVNTSSGTKPDSSYPECPPNTADTGQCYGWANNASCRIASCTYNQNPNGVPNW